MPALRACYWVPSQLACQHPQRDPCRASRSRDSQRSHRLLDRRLLRRGRCCRTITIPRPNLTTAGAFQVPSLFQDNFDYGDIRRDFVYGVLTSDLLMKNIYCYVAKDGYAARVADTRSYDAVRCVKDGPPGQSHLADFSAQQGHPLEVDVPARARRQPPGRP